MSESTQQQTDGEEAVDTADDADETQEEEYVRATFYFRESKKKEFERWLKMKELENPDTVDHDAIDRRDQHEAIINLLMANEEQFIERVADILAAK